MKKQTVKINVPANLHLSALVRNFSEELFGVVGFNDAWCSRLKLVVDELFMNAVCYGSLVDESIVHISCSYDSKTVTFTVSDEGVGPKKITAEALRSLIRNNEKNKTLTQTSGRGLAMITSLWTDELNITDSDYGGISVSFVKEIDSVSIPPRPQVTPFNIEDIQGDISFDDIVPAEGVEQKQASTSDLAGPIIGIALHGHVGNYNIDTVVAPVDESIKNLSDNTTLEIDFKEIDYINSVFIGHLASWYNEVNSKGGHLVLKNAGSQIKDVLNIVGLSSVVKIQS